MDQRATYENRENYTTNAEVVSLKEWLITMLILCVPLVNIVMIFVWAFSRSTNPSKSNFFKAQLIFMLIGIVLWVLFFGAIMSSIIAGSLGGGY